MKIKEAIQKGIRRVFSPIWKEENAYFKLPEIINGNYGVWIELYSEKTQEMLGLNIPQRVRIFDLIHSIESDCEEYNGPISKYEKEDKNE